jgi:hypothetical protein
LPIGITVAHACVTYLYYRIFFGLQPIIKRDSPTLPSLT